MWWKLAIGVIVVLGIGLCGAGSMLIGKFWDYGSAANELPAALARAKELGMPLVAADLAPNPPVTIAENAAPALRAMSTEIQGFNTNKIVSEITTSVGAGDYAEAKRQMIPLKRLLDLATKAGNLPRVDFQRDWDLGPALTFPEFANTKAGIKLVCARAEIRAATGDVNGALQDLTTAEGLTRHAGAEPTLISALVGIASSAIVQATAERIAARWAGNESDLAALQANLERDTWRPDMLLAMKGEAYNGVAITRNLSQFGGERVLFSMEGNSDAPPMPAVNPQNLVRDGVPEGQHEQAFLARHLQLWSQQWPSIVKYQDDPRRAMAGMDQIASDIETKKGYSYKFSKLLFPVFSQAGMAAVKYDARHQVSLAYVKALRYRAAHGEFPATLQAVGVTAKDPFDSKPLRYKRTADSIRVYSIGQDMTDDGGLTRAEMMAKKIDNEGDEVAAYPPIKPKVSTPKTGSRLAPPGFPARAASPR